MLKLIWSKLFGESIDPSSINAELERQLEHHLSHAGLGETPESSLSTSLLIVSILRQAQCCYRCTLRYVGCFHADMYGYSAEELDLVLDHLLKRSSRSSITVCTACLGTLQHADDDATTIQPILNQLKAEQYETTSFALTLTLPLSLIHREKLLKVHIQDQLAQNPTYQAQNKIYAWLPDRVREAKDPIRSIMAQRLALASGLTSDVRSKFHITMCLAHTSTETEHLFLTQVKDPVLRIRKVKKRGIVTTVGESRQNIVEALKTLSMEEARSLTTIPPLPQTEKATVASITLLHDSALTGGRYNKYSRQCSQTPWIIKGKRLTELSVSDCIVGVFKEHHRCEDVKFVTAGREDADVRMLGTGRPFYCELVNPRRPLLSKEEYQQMETEINTASTSAAVQVRYIQNISTADTKLIKDGEETKRKTYQALVWFTQPVTDELLDRCNTKGRTPFISYQKTPIRVFQRRGAATREKTIHRMTVTRMEGNPDSHFAVIQLNTQAGTYIKEFVHGDLGRSLPNLATIAGVEGADLLALDVLEVDLVWPSID
ncbi:hypothetical protein [Absidia glauca]|uniref:tRNA pseudouridine(55) synthase n=1 Tax=Absidia glauca TaxID=4829 RepID=A0A168RQT2_ABSGL|nr:hypothetical protein [Absidia glauca]